MKATLEFKQENGSYRGGEDVVLCLTLVATRDEALEATVEKVVESLFTTNKPHQLDGCATREEFDGESDEYTQEELEELADNSKLCYCNDSLFVSPATALYKSRVVLGREELAKVVSKVLKNENWSSSLTEPDVFKLNKEVVRDGNAE